MKWLHRLFNPHCEHCLDEIHEERRCKTCEVLEMELNHIRNENERLLNQLLNPKIVTESKVDTSELKPVYTRGIPWNVRKQTLEREDRDRNEKLKEAGKPDVNEIEKLEKELGVNNGS